MNVSKRLDKIFRLSPFIASQFKQSPELRRLLAGELDLISDWGNFKQQNVQLDIFALPRKYRQSRLAVIATRDLASNNHIQTLQQTSQLARLLINFAYDTATAEFVQKYGKVINSQGELQKFIIFALGKLGGNELNYSSDVDLVFCYSGNGVSDGKKTIDAQSYFNRLGRRIIQILDSATGTGIVYRVDMRLRPFGSASPLACSIDNLLGYLETEGRDWERYAWLRASFVAGAATIARTVLNDIRPFIYRKYLDYGIFASLRQIKEQITRKQQNDLNNLKLGKGGIREIEFIIQTLQLTFAGRNKQLRSNNLYQQMHKLCEFRHLTVKELQQLTAAWLFLRRLENLCQIIHDTSSHHLPQNQEALVECMGLLTTYELQKKLQIHRDNVHHIFKQLFLTNQSKDHKPISNPQIQQIKDDIASKNFPKTSKHKMYAALDAIIPLLTKYDNSDTIIQRYQQVINAVSKRPSYLSMLIESPVILAKLIRQIAHSKYFSDSIAAMPSLLEILFDTLDEDDFVISLQWQQFAQKHNLDNSEQYLEVLCQFKQRMQFKAIMASVDKSHNSQITGKILTDLAEHILALVIAQAWQQIKQNTASTITTDALIVIAYGSMAMQDMHLQSDFDLVFILNQDITTTNHKFIMRWMKRIIHLLSIKTYFGSLYQLDTQLRPNGNAGAAIVTQSNFETYQLNDAWLWEHAALIKSRAVYANKEQKYWFQNLRKQVLTQKRDAKMVDKELDKMAHKLNKHRNKEHQKEFATLGRILKQAHTQPEIINILF